MIIEVGKRYKTESGDTVDVLRTDAGGYYPVVALVYTGAGRVTRRYTLDGYEHDPSGTKTRDTAASNYIVKAYVLLEDC